MANERISSTNVPDAPADLTDYYIPVDNDSESSFEKKLITEITKPSDVAAVAPENSWSQTGLFAEVGYYVSNGICYLQGNVLGNSATDPVIITLPTAVRPADIRRFSVTEITGLTANFVDVKPDGSVENNLNGQANSTVSLEGINFKIG